MHPVIGLILIGAGIAALAKTFFEEDKNNVQNSSDSSSGNRNGKQDSTTSKRDRGDRIVINNVMDRSKGVPPDAPPIKKRKKKEDKNAIPKPDSGGDQGDSN